MELYIRIKDGQPFEHPIFGDNFRQAFPSVDVNNLPPEFARFTRVAQPSLSAYEVYEGVTYEWQDGGVTDVHHVRSMTDAEKTEKQNEVKTQWGEHGYASWTFDDTICGFVPPTPRPTDNKLYRWDEVTRSWLEVINAIV